MCCLSVVKFNIYFYIFATTRKDLINMESIVSFSIITQNHFLSRKYLSIYKFNFKLWNLMLIWKSILLTKMEILYWKWQLLLLTLSPTISFYHQKIYIFLESSIFCTTSRKYVLLAYKYWNNFYWESIFYSGSYSR